MRNDVRIIGGCFEVGGWGVGKKERNSELRMLLEWVSVGTQASSGASLGTKLYLPSVLRTANRF